MYDWVNGKPAVILRERDLARWPGGRGLTASEQGAFVAMREHEGVPAVVLRDHELTTLVPLELGGVLLVTAVYCDGDEAITSFLDMLPLSGWDVLPQRLVSDGGEYALFDGSLTATQLGDPRMADKIDREHGGVLTFPLPAGTYDVESFGPWHPDERTELWLTRVVRAGH